MNFLTDLFYVTLLSVCVGVTTIALSKTLDPIETHSEKIEREFRSACDNSGGKTVWNTRNWVCIK